MTDQKTGKKLLKESDEHRRMEFIATRQCHNMNQEEWAKALGISLGLVKRIESGTIKCSDKTLVKIEEFLHSTSKRQEEHSRHPLEENILFDILLANMKRTDKNTIVNYVQNNAQSLWRLISNTKSCDSDAERENYEYFLYQLFSVLSAFVSTNIDPIKAGKYSLDDEKLSEFLHIDSSDTRKKQHSKKKKDDVDGQRSLFDNFDS